MTLIAMSPNGTEIIGTLEKIPGCASVAFERSPDGKPTWDYDGNGTEMFWDDAVTVTRGGQTVFLDRQGGEWTEDQLTFKEDEE